MTPRPDTHRALPGVIGKVSTTCTENPNYAPASQTDCGLIFILRSRLLPADYVLKVAAVHKSARTHRAQTALANVHPGLIAQLQRVSC